ncbi:MAG: NAD(P)-dependent alcohol dehydrogenase [Myxococcales bacterium]|nr:NAD(P)-dependent alcohol dehydrogenase [Myxococcales bacterium]MCB9672702.1 NAD(P)-dependent alcohol dehydrogenase [Alphaproteobacteria bacterium]
MKVVAHHVYGGPEVLVVEEAPVPTPGPGQVRVAVRAVAVSSADVTFRKGELGVARLFTGPLRPKQPVLGTELAGVVDAVGEGVTRFAVGDRVYGATGDALGGYAEYVCVPEDGALAPMPAGTGFAEATALCEGVLTALPFLRDAAELKAGERVLVIGASGSVGTAAVQMARILGAHVTAVCSGKNADLVRSLGADAVVDYQTTDFTALGETWDVVFDAVGASSFGVCEPVLTEGGRYLTTVLGPRIAWDMLVSRVVGTRRAGIALTGLRDGAAKAEDLAFLTGLAESGQVRAVIDGRFPFEQAVAAHRLVESGHKVGNAVLEVA